MDALLFKEHVYTTLAKHSHRFQKRDRVSGETRNRLDYDKVDFSGFAVLQKPLKTGTVLSGTCPGFVRIDSNIEPAGVFLYHFTVMADLRGERMKHGVLAG